MAPPGQPSDNGGNFAEKRQIVEETLIEGASVARIARAQDSVGDLTGRKIAWLFWYVTILLVIVGSMKLHIGS